MPLPSLQGNHGDDAAKRALQSYLIGGEKGLDGHCQLRVKESKDEIGNNQVTSKLEHRILTIYSRMSEVQHHKPTAHPAPYLQPTSIHDLIGVP